MISFKMVIGSTSDWLIPVSSALLSLFGVVTGAFIAIKVAKMNSDRELARLRQLRLDARRDELNQVFDEAIQHVHAGYRILLAIRGEGGRDSPDWSRLDELGQALNTETGAVAECGLRIDARTPNGSEVAKAQREANRIFLDYNGEYRAYLAGDYVERKKPPRPPEDEAFRRLMAVIEQIRAYAGVVEPLLSPPSGTVAAPTEGGS
jgi:hypothetical protein